MRPNTKTVHSQPANNTLLSNDIFTKVVKIYKIHKPDGKIFTKTLLRFCGLFHYFQHAL